MLIIGSASICDPTLASKCLISSTSSSSDSSRRRRQSSAAVGAVGAVAVVPVVYGWLRLRLGWGKWCQIYKSKSNVFIHNDSILVHEYIHSHATTTLWLNIHRFRFNDIIILGYEYIHLLSLHIFIHTQNQNFYSTRLQYLFNFFKGSKIHKFHFLHIKRINSFYQIYIHLHSRHYISVWI